ncbi:MAG: phosphatase PAP2 family protein [Candidatus Kryptoniota bacterium]
MDGDVCGLLNGKGTVLSSVFIFSMTLFVGQLHAQQTDTALALRDTSVNAMGGTTSQTSYSIESVPDTISEHEEVYMPKWDSMLANLPTDCMRFTTESFQTKNIPLTIGIAGLTAGLMVADNRLWQDERGLYDRSLTFREFSNDMVWVGDGRVQFGVVGLFAAYGFVFNNDRALRTASQTTEAILACGAVVQLLKHVSGREQPDVASETGGDWTFFPSQISYLKHVPHYDAFPSGHIATTATTLVVIAENYPELTWFRPASYVLIGAVSSSLVAYGIHWWSDIPLGIVLGYAFGEIASHPFAVDLNSKSVSGSPSLSFEPVMLQGGVGVGVGLSF